MGLFGKLKAMKNAVTGGGARVWVEIDSEGVEVGEGFDIKVCAEAKTAFEIKSVYIIIKAEEEAHVLNERGELTREVMGPFVTFEQRFDIAGGESLKAGETYEWEAEITLPEECNPSFDGEMISHTWSVFGALDARGNDPDSGWTTFEVE